MSVLEKLQNQFQQAVLSPNSVAPEFIQSEHPEERLQIYRQSIVDNLRKALSVTYPGVWALLGEECANSVALAFCRDQKNLPRSGCLDDWGEQFPDFMAQIPELQSLPYLRDYAYYEWLKHQAYRAEAATPINATLLQIIPEDQIETTILQLLPSVFTFHSNYSLADIAAVIADPNSENIQLSNKPAYAIIARPENTVTTFWVQPDIWTFVNDLHQKIPLGQAYAKTTQQFSEFDLPHVLQFLLTERLITMSAEKKSQL